MDKELKANWVAALRSGEYRQTVGRLYREDSGSYCCLGVLTAIVNPVLIAPTGKGVDVGSLGYLPRKVRLAACQSDKVQDWEYTLQDMNDGGRFTFPQIADYIEANL